MRYLFMDASENATGSQYGDEHGFNSQSFDTDRNLGARISEICDDMLKQANCAFADIDLLAVCTGPGSLTGLRIAAGFFRTLALASNKPITGIDIFSWSLKHLQMQGVTGKIKMILPTLIDKAFSVEADITGLDCQPACLCERNEVGGPDTWSIRCDLPGCTRVEPSPEALHSLLINRPGSNRFEDILGVLPMYVIPSQAERKFEEKKC